MQKSGITLIALVVTIIVLIILAAVSLNLILGQNGIISRAQEAKSETEIAGMKEKITLDLVALESDAIINNRKVTIEEVEAVLLKYAASTEDIIKDEDGKSIGISLGKDKILLDDFYDLSDITDTPIVDNTAPTATIGYSTTSPTNASVIATMITSEKILVPAGWTKVSATKYTKTYTVNISETIEIADLAGNKSNVFISINNIDTTAPNGTATYSTAAYTNTNVTVTITTNKVINIPSDWARVDDTHYTRVYTTNMTENITITDLANNTGIVQVIVNNIDKTPPGGATMNPSDDISSSNLDISGSTFATITITASDDESGIAKIELLERTDRTQLLATDSEWSSAIDLTLSGTNPKTATYNIQTMWSNCYLHTRITDVAGNVTVSTVNAGYYLYYCFEGGTKVLTADGLQNIEDIKVGDFVYSRNMETNEIEIKEVIRTIHTVAIEIYRIKIGDEVIGVTSGHPIYIEGKGWQQVKAIRQGDKVLKANGELVEILDIQIEEYEAPVDVYNFTIEGNNNYFFGWGSFLSHNSP